MTIKKTCETFSTFLKSICLGIIFDVTAIYERLSKIIKSNLTMLRCYCLYDLRIIFECNVVLKS